MNWLNWLAEVISGGLAGGLIGSAIGLLIVRFFERRRRWKEQKGIMSSAE